LADDSTAPRQGFGATRAAKRSAETMLERTRGPRHDVRLASDRGAGPDEFITYADIARFFSRYWLTIAISVFLSLAAAGYYVISARPMFTARAQILIDPRLSSVLREQLGETTLSLDS